jgi:hypothetical protein
VDPNVRDKFGNSLLAVATQNNRKRIVKVGAGIKAIRLKVVGLMYRL